MPLQRTHAHDDVDVGPPTADPASLECSDDDGDALAQAEAADRVPAALPFSSNNQRTRPGLGRQLSDPTITRTGSAVVASTSGRLAGSVSTPAAAGPLQRSLSVDTPSSTASAGAGPASIAPVAVAPPKALTPPGPSTDRRTASGASSPPPKPRPLPAPARARHAPVRASFTMSPRVRPTAAAASPSLMPLRPNSPSSSGSASTRSPHPPMTSSTLSTPPAARPRSVDSLLAAVTGRGARHSAGSNNSTVSSSSSSSSSGAWPGPPPATSRGNGAGRFAQASAAVAPFPTILEGSDESASTPPPPYTNALDDTAGTARGGTPLMRPTSLSSGSSLKPYSAPAGHQRAASTGNWTSLMLDDTKPHARAATTTAAAADLRETDLRYLSSAAHADADEYPSRRRFSHPGPAGAGFRTLSLPRNLKTVTSMTAQNALSLLQDWRARAADAVSDLVRGATGNEQEDVQAEDPFAFLPMLGSALQVPFAALAGDTMPPIILEALQVRVHVATDDASNQHRTFKMQPFRIACRYGPHTWAVQRTVGDFLAMHLRLSAHYYLELLKRKLPPLPFNFNFALDQVAANTARRHSTIVPESTFNFAQDLQRYLQQLLQALNMLPEITPLGEFLAFSALSFDPRFPSKPVEARVSLRLNPRWTCAWFTAKEADRTRDQWVLVGPSWLTVLADLAKPDPVMVILVTPQFSVESVHDRDPLGFRQVALLVNPARGVPVNAARTLRWEVEDEPQHDLLYKAMRDMLDNCEYAQVPRWSAFAPPRAGGRVEFFVDGEEYFERVADAIDGARRSVYILDWWLSPEVYMKRPICPENEEWRLDRLLQRKAKEGVQIYIIVYKEVTAALSNCSFHTKFYLVSLHPNIHVQRHPDMLKTTPFWAHHEKAVVIDDRVAYLGGLDLCYGRWDSHAHPLVDLAPPESGAQLFPGQDFSNPRHADFRSIDTTWMTDLLDRTRVPRMPWHDVACALHGPTVADLARHFVQRWNYVKARKAAGRNDLPLLFPGAPVPEVVVEERRPGAPHSVQLTRSLASWSCGVPTEKSILTAYETLIDEAKYFVYIENQFFGTLAQCSIQWKGDDVMTDRIYRAYTQREPFRVIVMMPLLPAFAGPIESAAASTLRMVMNYQFESISRGPNSLIARLEQAGIPADEYVTFYGLRTFDFLDASATAAAAAAAAGKHSPSTESLAPWPGAPASEFATPTTEYDMVTLVEDPQGLTTTATPPPLRPRAETALTLASNEGKFVTEMVYIHTKLMIVDDRHAILGSANINDRSMLGDRDSELAIVISGQGDAWVPMGGDGQEVVVDSAIHDLRMKLMKEHLGQLGDASEDHVLANVLAPEFEHLWHGTARRNTAVFRDVFHCVPDDTGTCEC
ncbi:hypothetical protein AMAG_04357 [Allomyces macrogynus ATCC 38327]|uniref:phospholipase D n=1 Tax=Allomyces macrogynus (strain ATCC 38327) TaxID=578462 RepID=A0A0L0S8K1_ALLM3|nr:hypothetical protein AMAG_04357 [Allomyces macrogynus ATCC 38327]|eukprot:KNE58807.1 hypothetical protein AMAG_04357 [Allomyces macrogynus ATCC 38327]